MYECMLKIFNDFMKLRTLRSFGNHRKNAMFFCGMREGHLSKGG